MKKFLFIYLLFFSFVDASINLSSKEPNLLQTGEEKHWCPITGLSLAKTYKGTFYARLQMNERLRQYSSLYALIQDEINYGLKKNSIHVMTLDKGDYIKVQQAYFILGGSVTPTFGKTPIIAFALEKKAKEHIKKYGGELQDFQQVYSFMQKNMKAEKAYEKGLHVKRIYPMGKRVLKQMCPDKVDPTEFFEISELKLKLLSTCKPLKEEYLHAVTKYLWEVQRRIELGEVEGKVEVRKDEKCPVCGMFTYKYPRWAAQIYYGHDDHEHRHSFDGVKDMMKFYFDPMRWGDYSFAKKESITKILVTDYYTQKGIDARKAFYVIGSDTYGPMGHELIPFANKEDAKTFKKDHKGDKILSFKEIEETLVYELDNPNY